MDLLVVSFSALAAGSLVWGLFLLRQGEVSRLIRAMEGQPRRSAPTLLQPLRRFLPAAKLSEFGVLLTQAGRPHGLDADRFLSLKLALTLVCPALAALLTLGAPPGLTGSVALLVALTAFLGPDLWLSGRVARRRRQARAELPLFADLTATAVSAGLPLPEAVRRVAADLDGLVAREFLRAVQEMAAGKGRVQAWRDLVARVPGEEFRSLVQAIMQAEQHGTSVADLLRYQVRQLRALKLAEAQRTAQAASVKMRIPMLESE